MQYRTGKNAVENANNIFSSMDCFIFNALLIKSTKWHEITKDIATKKINPSPICLVFLPRLVVNSIVSLSKVRGLPTFTRITAEANITRAKITPSGCGTMYPSARLIKNSRKNKTLNKLSLFNLALMKLRIVASFCVLHKYTLCPIVAKKQLYIQYFRQYYFLYSINIVNMLYLRYYIRMSILSGTKL